MRGEPNIAEPILENEEGVYEREWEVVDTIMGDYMNGISKQPWSPMKADRLAKILRDYAKTGVVRDEKGLEQIATEIFDKVAALLVNTVLCSHSPMCPIVYLKEYGYENVDRDMFEKFSDDYFWDDTCGQWRISDKVGELVGKCHEMQACLTHEDLLCRISELLNIIHMRSDISSWLIDGGNRRLSELSNMNIWEPIGQ